MRTLQPPWSRPGCKNCAATPENLQYRWVGLGAERMQRPHWRDRDHGKFLQRLKLAVPQWQDLWKSSQFFPKSISLYVPSDISRTTQLPPAIFLVAIWRNLPVPMSLTGLSACASLEYVHDHISTFIYTVLGKSWVYGQYTMKFSKILQDNPYSLGHRRPISHGFWLLPNNVWRIARSLLIKEAETKPKLKTGETLAQRNWHGRSERKQQIRLRQKQISFVQPMYGSPPLTNLTYVWMSEVHQKSSDRSRNDLWKVSCTKTSSQTLALHSRKLEEFRYNAVAKLGTKHSHSSAGREKFMARPLRDYPGELGATHHANFFLCAATMTPINLRNTTVSAKS